MKRISLLFVALVATSSYAQDFSNFKPSGGIAGSAGLGLANFDVAQPAANFRLDKGIFAQVAVEKSIGNSFIYLVLGLGFMSANGQTNYDYTTLAGSRYTATDVRFKSNLFQMSLGLRVKLLPGWFRPYVEAGGLAGYYQIKYDSALANLVQGTGSNYVTSDSLLEFGLYAEAGAELSFNPKFGLRIAARLTHDESKKFETLANNRVRFQSEVYYLSALAYF